MKITKTASGIVLVACALMSGCSAPKAAKEKAILINGRPYLTNMPLRIAEAEGYFAAEGLRIRYVDLPDHTSQAIPALDKGRLDVIAGMVSVGFFNAVARGSAVRVVADKGHIDPRSCDFSGIVGRRGVFPDQAISTADIRGRRFSITFAGSSGFIFSRFLESLQLGEKDISTVGLPAATEAQALESGAIDGLVTMEPWLSRLVGAGHKLITPARVLAPGHQQAVLLFGPTLLSDDPDAGARFMRAYLRGVRRFNEGHTPSNEKLVAAETGLDSLAVRNVCWPAFHPDGIVDPDALAEFQKWALDRGMLDRLVASSEYLDSRFAVQAAASLRADPP